MRDCCGMILNCRWLITVNSPFYVLSLDFANQLPFPKCFRICKGQDTELYFALWDPVDCSHLGSLCPWDSYKNGSPKYNTSSRTSFPTQEQNHLPQLLLTGDSLPPSYLQLPFCAYMAKHFANWYDFGHRWTKLIILGQRAKRQRTNS